MSFLKYQNRTSRLAGFVLPLVILPLVILLFVATGCGSKSKPGDETNGTSSGKNGSSSASESSTNGTDSGDTKSAKSGPAKPKLNVQVVKGQEKGQLDIFVTNNDAREITNCKAELFPGVKINVGKKIGPGQVAMCAIGGEIPKKLTFDSDQFEDFEFTMPAKPLEEIDMSLFDWADQDESADDDQPVQQIIRPKKEKKDKDSAPADLLDFGDDGEDVAPGARSKAGDDKDDTGKKDKSKEDKQQDDKDDKQQEKSAADKN